MPLSDHLLLGLLALLLEAACGYPDLLFRIIRHPVVWIGALISLLERSLNHTAWSFFWRRAGGVLALLVLLVVCGGIGFAISQILRALPYGILLEAALACSLLAQQSLGRHVAAVALGLETGGLAAGREAVSQIVGRDPQSLDQAGVARAAIESLAENFSDGVVAPFFWLLLGGLPGILLYKAINTADSMIGHKSPRYLAFGWAAARIDDLVNLPASRLSALLLSLVAPGRLVAAWRVIWRDAPRHRSPNAGWPEAAMAQALGLRLAGPRRYAGEIVADAWMGDGRPEAGAADIRAALRLYRQCLLLLWSGLAVAWGLSLAL
ncbi:adenosylcobinamide-phosphate synthase CbiB [Ferrovibrio sp.]|uniref:adenosylcobinamide-phosphate synthase CbiB n=1 Tax=Ferrovibrio sp. TaxID=1917215 RepID=UPI001B631FA9|nr:adenosylcobinamide-phosphate synthase CbiB [Ferrovibrio sp.]MBP7063247.1 cobalamin biosynthesis protein CobD [Ferrovibrio sp.]